MIDCLPSWSRKGAIIDQVVLHESVTSSRATTLRVLKARGLGVHYIVDRDGTVTQHAPVAEQCAHAGWRHNRRSVAVEIVNRYYGAQAAPMTPTIKAVWAHRGWYVLPTAPQCEAVWGVVVGLHESIPTLPLVFPGATNGRFTWGRLPLLSRWRLPAGIMAHHRTGHADGLFQEHYCWLRSFDHSPVDAYRMTADAASSGLRVTSLPASGV
jgi:hypothetical protein